MNYEQHYPFPVEPLPYAYDALEPYIDRETMELHHDKHYATYVEKLNAALKEHPDYQNYTLEELLKSIDSLPDSLKTPVQNFGGGVYNHQLYFENLSGDREEASDELKAILTENFGSLGEWEEQLIVVAMSQFGSGYGWMVMDEHGKLKLMPSLNQNVPDLRTLYPILVIDVWEHAYYLKYQNRRNEYLDNIGYVINWKVLEERIARAMQ